VVVVVTEIATVFLEIELGGCKVDKVVVVEVWEIAGRGAMVVLVVTIGTTELIGGNGRSVVVVSIVVLADGINWQ
jgi:hypothetical protein